MIIGNDTYIWISGASYISVAALGKLILQKLDQRTALIVNDLIDEAVQKELYSEIRKQVPNVV